MYEGGDQPSRVIATLDALAIVAAIKTLFNDETSGCKRKVKLVLALTDSRGNGSVVNKLMSAKVMELAKL